MYFFQKNFKPQTLFIIPFLAISCAKPLANFSYKAPEGNDAPSNISFENNSQKATDYEWSFGDGKTSTEAKPSHRYLSSGEYTIQLKAKKGSKSNVFQQKIKIEPPKQCMAEIETEYGNMTVLFFDATPLHRDNFLKLAEDGFYDGTIFHRVISGFMIQGGDPNSKNATPEQQLGGGDLGYTVPAEFVDTLVHIKGMLCAARTGDNVNPKKRSSGSQFYIVHGRPTDDKALDYNESVKEFRYSKENRAAYKELGGTPMLDREYTVFGKVIIGLDVIDKIANVETQPGDRPKKDVKMKVIAIR